MEINEIKDLLSSFMNEEDMDEFIKLYTMPDEQFSTLAPFILQEITKTFNTPENIYGILALMRKEGQSLEESLGSLDAISQVINDSELSKPKKEFTTQIFSIMSNALYDACSITKKVVNIPIELLSEDIKVPTYANIGDAGLDIYAPMDYTINPGETILIKCGFKVAVPQGYELQVRPKSGLSLKSKLRIANAPGTIDSGYRDEVGVIIENIDAPYKDSNLYGSTYYIEKGQKFAQLVLQQVPTVNFEVVESIDLVAGNRGGGFGSSGKF